MKLDGLDNETIIDSKPSTFKTFNFEDRLLLSRLILRHKLCHIIKAFTFETSKDLATKILHTLIFMIGQFQDRPFWPILKTSLNSLNSSYYDLIWNWLRQDDKEFSQWHIVWLRWAVWSSDSIPSVEITVTDDIEGFRWRHGRFCMEIMAPEGGARVLSKLHWHHE